MSNEFNLNVRTGYTGSMMAYDAAKTYYQERQESQRHSAALSSQRDLQRMAYDNQAASEKREREFASQQAAENRATQERIARMNRDMAIEAAHNAETIRRMELDAEQRIREEANRSAERVAEINLQAERQRGLETAQFIMAERERLAEAQRKREADAIDEKRRGGIIKDFENVRIKGTYEGEYLREVPHGNGVFYYDDNRRYEGGFAAGKFDGTGRWFDFDGRLVYEGDWCGGRFNGNGCLKIDEGKYFVGEFKSGRMHKGVIVYTPSSQIPPQTTIYTAPHLMDSFDSEAQEYSYEGEMDGSIPNGKGKKTYHNGDTDDGIFKNGKAEGFIVRQRNGNVYMGNVVDNIENGYGFMTFANGDVYDGQWKDGRIFGQGRYTHNDIIYQGKWEDCGKLLLEGEALLQNGRLWKGSFSDFILLGKGVCSYPNGETFIGEADNFKPILGEVNIDENGIKTIINVKDGKMSKPLTTYPDGTTFLGIWKDGEWKQGTLILADKTKYIGEFLDFNFNGFGIMEYISGETYSGQWQNGRWHGKGDFKLTNGNVITGIWDNGFLK